jgi:hypothetical protein
MAASSVAQLRHDLDAGGCAYGQVSRERIAHVAEGVERIERKLNYIIGVIGVQLVSFFLAMLLYAVQHSGLHP